MFSFQKILVIIGLLIMTYCSSAQNPDILWQKTLTKDTIPIASIAIAEGKYVAVLKGDEIIILDYNTGDSIRAFAKPSDMYGNDIVLGKDGERLYVYIKPINTTTPNTCYLRSWDTQTGFQFSDISMEPTFQSRGGPLHHVYYSFSTSASLNGNLIVVQTSYHETAYGIGESTGTAIKMFNTIDSTLFSRTDTPDSVSFFFEQKNIISSIKKSVEPSGNKKAPITLQSGTNNVSFSQSGNYLLLNYTLDGFYRYGSGVTGGYYSYTYGKIKSMIPALKSFEYDKNIPTYKFSSDDDFLMDGSNLYNIPPTNIFRTLNKTGFVFLPDDNHMLAFHEAGGVAAISNIEKDTWEKIYRGDSLTENIIQTNAARSAFATATNNRITLWKIPDTLQTAALTADFNMSKDSIPIFDSITFSNRTFPMKRGASYEWNFGDGTTNTNEIFPIHKFTKAGTFTVILSVRDTLGRTSVTSKNVVVSFPFPKAGFTTPKDTVYVGDMVSFTNTSTPIRNGTYFNWNFGDGASSTEFNPKHQFFQTGTFTIKLSIHDTLVRKDNTTKTIVVIDQVAPKGASWVNHFHTEQINSLAFSSDGKNLISGSDDGFSRMFDVLTNTQTYSQYFKQVVSSVTFTKNSKSAVLGNYLESSNSPVFVNNSVAYFHNYIYLWNFSYNSLEKKLDWQTDLRGVPLGGNYKYRRYQNSSLSCMLSENENWFVIGSKTTILVNKSTIDTTLMSHLYTNSIVYNFSTQKSKVIEWFSEPIFSTLISPDNLFYIISFASNSIMYDANTSAIKRSFPWASSSMHFSPDKFHLLTNTGLWNIYDSILVKTVDLPSTFEYHPDGIHVFTLRADSTIGIYNLNTNSYEYIYPKQPTTFTALAVAPDGKHIATGDKYGYITVWNVPDSLKTSFKVDFNTTLFKRSNLKENDTVTFANTTLPANNTFDFLWNFGDGSTSTEKNPKHVYFKSGTYTVTLSALNNGKVIDSMIKLSYITIEGPLDTQEAKSSFETTFSIIPNPSYGETTLSYTLSQPSPVQIRITDVLGKEVNSWSLNESEGMHTLVWNGSSVGTGMYYCTFCAQGLIRTLPFVVLQ